MFLFDIFAKKTVKQAPIEQSSYNKITKFWKEMNKRSSFDHLLFALLKAYHSKNEDKEYEALKLISLSFSPTKNINKLVCNNNYKEYFVFRILFSKQNPLAAKSELWCYIRNESWYRNFLDFFYKTMNQIMNEDNRLNRHYSFIFVETHGWTKSYSAVQAAHAAMLVGQRMNKKHDARKIYFHLLERPHDTSPHSLEDFYPEAKFHHFYEPDQDKIIASATEPLIWHKAARLKELPFLTL